MEMIWLKIYTRLQLVPSLLAGRWWWVALVLIAVALFGRRVYCRFICPLGLLQSLVRGFMGRRRICSRLDRANWTHVCDAALRVLLFVLVLIALPLYFLDPYAMVSRVVAFWYSPERDWALALVLLVPALVVLALALVTHGRGWCNYVCPVGTILSLIGMRPWKGDAVKACSGCKKCGRCMK